MEHTRTPSTLAKVSVWSIVIMGTADSWIFSAHVVVGIMSDNKTSLPMLVPGFLCLCTAIVFAPVSLIIWLWLTSSATLFCYTVFKRPKEPPRLHRPLRYP
jgi:hypothetical protein